MCGTGDISVSDLRQHHNVIDSGSSFKKVTRKICEECTVFQQRLWQRHKLWIWLVQWRIISVLHVQFALENNFLPSTATENRRMPTFAVLKTTWVYNSISSIIKFSTSDNAFRVLWLVHSILIISSYNPPINFHVILLATLRHVV